MLAYSRDLVDADYVWTSVRRRAAAQSQRLSFSHIDTTLVRSEIHAYRSHLQEGSYTPLRTRSSNIQDVPGEYIASGLPGLDSL